LNFPKFSILNFKDEFASPEMLGELKVVFAEVLTLNVSHET